MKQVAQRPRDGRIAVVEAPLPTLRHGQLLVENRFSLISAGTERSRVHLGGKSLVQKARARPDLVRKTVDHARVEGLRSAFGTARERLEALSPIGYSSAGVVSHMGTGVEGIAPGDRVACAGGGWANHAEVVAVPRNLVAKVPDGVPLDAAAYATVGAVALHGVRRAEAAVGERVGVIGLGLVGQLALRTLLAAGCHAVGVDRDPAAVELATAAGGNAFGRDQPGLESAVRSATEGLGLDAVLVCAGAASADPLQLAARLARDRGRLVVVGDVPVELDRELLYDKELELRLSRSYGAGRYDRDYEERGRDLPAGYVRWTEQRNLAAFLDLIARGGVDPTELTTHRFPVEDAPRAYAALSGESERRPFGILLEYREQVPSRSAPPVGRGQVGRRSDRVRVGVIGAGAFARGTLLPALRTAGAELVAVATASGLSGADVASRFGFERAAGSTEEIVEDDTLDAVVIATRHSTHAPLAAAALREGRSVFVEKPLAISNEQLQEVEEALATERMLMVGFNRRFAPLTRRLREELPAGGRVLVARVNAGPLADDHWLNDPEEGGGRLVGEGCHFVDLLIELAGAEPVTAYAVAAPRPERPLECSDDFVGTLRFAGAGVATLVYSGAGDARLAKERIEAFAGGAAAVLDDFRRLELFHDGRRKVVRRRQDKGHAGQMARFVDAVAGRAEPPSPGGYLTATRATLALAESLRAGAPVTLATSAA